MGRISYANVRVWSGRNALSTHHADHWKSTKIRNETLRICITNKKNEALAEKGRFLKIPVGWHNGTGQWHSDPPSQYIN